MRPLRSSIRRSAALLGATVLLGPAAAAAGGGWPEVVTVRPGSVVRWSAPGTTWCRLEGRSWAPWGETCFLPVDLRRTGEIVAERVIGGERERLRLRVGDYPYEVQRIEIEDESRVHLSPEDLERVRRENRRIAALWSRRGPRRFILPLAPPVDPLPPGGRFGARRIVNGEPRSPHTGADFAAAAGTPVRAAASGVVALAEEHFFAGNSVFLDHGNGLVSMYFHLDGIAVEAGEEVIRGATIGTVGSSGRATGPHLHFGLRWRGARIDPALLLAPVDELPAVE